MSEETLEILGPSDTKWTPVVGEEAAALVSRLSEDKAEEEVRQLLRSSISILQRGIDPSGQDATATGLVVGYVQSGKTMSFTTVAALAADNGFAIVIVITGTTNDLFEQSADRLSEDLCLDSRSKRKWLMLREPRRQDEEQITQILEDWADPNLDPSDRNPLLIAVKKGTPVLRKLIAVLGVGGPIAVPVLIIDDEADQASLNNLVNQDRTSTVYRLILQLRALFPKHTFVQYTATPQANLLISLLDTLSPQYAEILLPGGDYTGGIEFFGSDRRLVRTIPPEELPSRGRVMTEPPLTLLEALRMFFLGVACSYVQGLHNEGNRSMLIHPSREINPHNEFASWTRSVKSHWHAVLGLDDEDPDKQELIESFKASFDELAATVGPGIPAWEAVQAKLRRAIHKTIVVEVNSRGRPTRGDRIDWRNYYSLILVGGAVLERGFTVRGLTVTYMPRGRGVGNADTIQQRARFFGYKKSYIGYCRIYLDTDVIDAFCDYVEHEEDVRRQLNELAEKQLPLAQWRRAFLMPEGLQPTRRSVLSVAHIHDTYEDAWFWTRSPHTSDEVVNANTGIFHNIRACYPFTHLEPLEYGQPAARHAAIKGVCLRHVFNDILLKWRVSEPEDAQAYQGVMLQIAYFLKDNPDEVCDLIEMNPGERTQRAVDTDADTIDNIFQGSNREPGDPLYYPGDRLIRREEVLTIQLRMLDLTDRARQLIVQNVPVLAIWIPGKMSRYWLVQSVR
jgi:hypothetical protein